ncbi:hypothetical protein PAMA_015452 [Pampus argenteus]
MASNKVEVPTPAPTQSCTQRSAGSVASLSRCGEGKVCPPTHTHRFTIIALLNPHPPPPPSYTGVSLHSPIPAHPPQLWGRRDSLFIAAAVRRSAVCQQSAQSAERSATLKTDRLSHTEREDLHTFTGFQRQQERNKLTERVRPGASVALPQPITLNRAALCPLNREEDDTGLDIPFDTRGDQ